MRCDRRLELQGSLQGVLTLADHLAYLGPVHAPAIAAAAVVHSPAASIVVTAFGEVDTALKDRRMAPRAVVAGEMRDAHTASPRYTLTRRHRCARLRQRQKKVSPHRH